MTSTLHSGRSPMSIVSFLSWECSDQASEGMLVPLSCPALCRASTSFSLNWKKQDVDGRVKPGHDETGVVSAHGTHQARLLSGPFGPKKGPGDWRWTSHSPTGSGPEGSSPNEVRIGSLVSLLPVFSSESRKTGDPVLRWILFPLFRKPASRDNQSCGSIDDRRWRSLNAPQRFRQHPSRRLRPRRPARGRQALSRVGAKISPLQFRRSDRPRRHGPYPFERLRNRQDPASLDSDRGARRRQNHHCADSRPRAELRTA